MQDIILIDNEEYIRKAAIKSQESSLPYKIIRGKDSGIFAGYMEYRQGQEVSMVNARRIWYWDMDVAWTEGAAFLSQLAEKGVTKAKGCKFPRPVSKVMVLDVVEVLDVADVARKSIEGIPIWER